MAASGAWVAVTTIYYAVHATLPAAEVMGAVGVAALVANLVVAALLYRYRQSDSRARSVWLCTRNDALVNLAVIAAGGGVRASGTQWPDMVVAAVVAGLSLSSAARITLRAWGEMRESLGPFPAAAE